MNYIKRFRITKSWSGFQFKRVIFYRTYRLIASVSDKNRGLSVNSQMTLFLVTGTKFASRKKNFEQISFIVTKVIRRLCPVVTKNGVSHLMTYFVTFIGDDFLRELIMILYKNNSTKFREYIYSPHKHPIMELILVS